MNSYLPIKFKLNLLILILAPDSFYVILQISRKMAPYTNVLYDEQSC